LTFLQRFVYHWILINSLGIKEMKKIIKTLSVALLLQYSVIGIATANEMKVKIGGLFDFSGAMVFPDKSSIEAKDKIIVTPHNEDYGFYSSGNIFIDVSNKINEETSYGIKMSLVATTRNNKTAPSFLYFISKLGKIELGSNKSAAKTLGITGYSNACNFDFSDWVNTDPNSKNIKYTETNISYLDSKGRVSNETEYSRKVSYYTPELSGFQAGISYIPDLSNSGMGPLKNSHYYEIANYFYQDNVDNKTKRVPLEFSVKNAIAAGISFKQDLENDFGLKLAATIEKGTTIVKQNDKKVNDLTKDSKEPNMSKTDLDKYKGAKFKDLMSYMVGGEIKYKDFSLAASYTNAGDSFTSVELDGDNNKSDCIIVGGRYNFEKLGTSVSYLTSDNKKNKFNAITFALDYKLAEGLNSYAEFTKYQTDGIDPIATDKKDKQKGSIFILGAKLAF
jgi:hypothetical protein